MSKKEIDSVKVNDVLHYHMPLFCKPYFAKNLHAVFIVNNFSTSCIPRLNMKKSVLGKFLDFSLEEHLSRQCTFSIYHGKTLSKHWGLHNKKVFHKIHFQNYKSVVRYIFFFKKEGKTLTFLHCGLGDIYVEVVRVRIRNLDRRPKDCWKLELMLGGTMVHILSSVFHSVKQFFLIIKLNQVNLPFRNFLLVFKHVFRKKVWPLGIFFTQLVDQYLFI